MTFKEILAEVIDWLQENKRLSYRGLKRQFDLDDEHLEDLKEELLYAHPVVDDEGRGLIWTGDTEFTPSPTQSMHQREESESRFHDATRSNAMKYLVSCGASIY